MGNNVDLDEVAQFEPLHQDPHCLGLQLFSSRVLKVEQNILKFCKSEFYH